MKRLLLVSLLAACSSSKARDVVPADEARQLLIDRNWLDRMPETDRDRLHVYRFVPTMGGGVYQDRTLYKGTFELFKFSATGTEIKFDLPETKTEVTSAYSIDKVSDHEPFDLRLTVYDSPRGPKVYYGMRSETDRTGEHLETMLSTKSE